MFGGKKVTASFGEQIETIIGKDTQLKGSLTSSGTIRLDGHFEGEVATTGDIIVGEAGNLKVQVKARNATIAGIVNGNMDIAEKLELLPTAKLYGDIKVGTLIIGEGATFKGACEMRRESAGPVPKEADKAAATLKS
ncbi:MAG: polymer-forming cytoskeletal protein [Negativicutes bacterium]|nr:polymer-forming cytoskeletal protein [Negativicutes bacterium]